VETLTYVAPGVKGRRSVTLTPDPLPRVVEARLGTVAEAVDPDARAVLLGDESVVYFDRLILAPGARPAHLPPGSIADGAVPFVQYFEGVTDFRALQESLGSAKEIAVVGGGRLGTELAASLAGEGDTPRSVSLLSRSGLPMSKWWPPYLAGAAAAELGRVGVTVRPDTEVVDIAATDDGLAASLSLSPADSTPLRADRVVLAVGSRPNIDLGRAAGLEVDEANGGIAASSELQTSRSHIFAAGDGASVFEPILGRRRIQHEQDAVASGEAAAKAALGDRTPFHRLPRASGRIGRLAYSAVGKIDASLPTVGIFDETAPPAERLHRGIVYYFDEKKNSVAGVLLVGVRGREGEAAKLVESERPYYDKTGLAPRFISIEDAE
jgi:programmed cell death 8 (apoptosis-inducing factor)